MTSGGDPKKVFIIHGRNTQAAHQLAIFVRSLGLTPIAFNELRARMGGTPTIAEIVTRGMDEAQGVIALFTGDEWSELCPQFRSEHDKTHELARWQARPNVIFEAGMAFGRDRSRVVFVVLGNAELFTDVAGIHVLRPTNRPSGDRDTLRRTLQTMGCTVEDSSAWMEAGDFESVCPSRMAVRSPFAPSDRSSEASVPKLDWKFTDPVPLNLVPVHGAVEQASDLDTIIAAAAANHDVQWRKALEQLDQPADDLTRVGIIRTLISGTSESNYDVTAVRVMNWLSAQSLEGPIGVLQDHPVNEALRLLEQFQARDRCAPALLNLLEKQAEKVGSKAVLAIHLLCVVWRFPEAANTVVRILANTRDPSVATNCVRALQALGKSELRAGIDGIARVAPSPVSQAIRKGLAEWQ